MSKQGFAQVVKQYSHRYFIKAMGAMALGLFASLLIGTIFDTVGTYLSLPFLCTVATYAKSVTGAAIGVAIAYALGAHPLVMFSAAAVGAVSNAMGAVSRAGHLLFRRACGRVLRGHHCL